MDEQAIRDLIKKAYDAFNRGDFDTDLSLATDDIEIVTVAFGESVRGSQAFRALLERWKRMAPDGRVEIVSQLVGTDGVTNENRFIGTNTGPVESPQGTIPSSSKSFDVPFVEVWRTST
ncbi:MAG: nuclear transport factor 2 family protein [Chloroflexota bacterium]|nr:MAG: hypothetical protein DLM70_14070 [Chloroflexota bacterium]